MKNLILQQMVMTTEENEAISSNIKIEAISRLNEKEEPEIGKELKVMTPKQMITRLPILLAQKQAGNNSQKLKNEIRQFIYSLYRSKNLSKTIYNHLINTI